MRHMPVGGKTFETADADGFTFDAADRRPALESPGVGGRTAGRLFVDGGSHAPS